MIGDGASKATELEKAVKEVVGRCGGNSNPEEPMLDLRSDDVCSLIDTTD